MLFSYLTFVSAFLTSCITLAASTGSGECASKKRSSCQDFSTTFSSKSVISTSGGASFVALSPSSTYELTDDGLQLNLLKPEGKITTKDSVNNKLGQGATVNSTFTLQYGVVTYRIKAPTVAGVVVAGILTASDGDEIDIELVSGDASHWQTNIFAPAKGETVPLTGVFGGIEGFDGKGTLASAHNYTIDWNADRIIWKVDGTTVRTLKPSDTIVKGVKHYPTSASRISLGIWDASSPVGTSDWGKGPINWKKAPSTISATVEGVWVECNN